MGSSIEGIYPWSMAIPTSKPIILFEADMMLKASSADQPLKKRAPKSVSF